MNQLTIFDQATLFDEVNLIDKLKTSVNQIPLPRFYQEKDEITNQVSTETANILNKWNEHINKFHFDNFHWHKIELFNWKIRRIYFRFWENSYLLNLDYDFYIKTNTIKNFSSPEDNQEERFFIFKNIKILSIQKKDRVWYWRINRPDYVKNIWLNFQRVSQFAQELIKNYHLNN